MKVNWKTLGITVAATLAILGYVQNAKADTLGAKVRDLFKVS